MVTAREIDMVAEAMIKMFDKEAPARAAEMVKEKKCIDDASGLAFWSKLQARIIDILDNETDEDSSR